MKKSTSKSFEHFTVLKTLLLLLLFSINCFLKNSQAHTFTNSNQKQFDNLNFTYFASHQQVYSNIKNKQWFTKIQISPWDIEDNFWIEPFVEYFVWKELNNQKSTIVKETGVKIGTGLSGIYNQSFLNLDLLLFHEAFLFGGKTKYEGHTWDGLPVESKGKYFGSKGELDIGIKQFSYNKILPYIGIGYYIWERDLTETQENVIGYKEIWSMLFCKIGLKILIEKTKGDFILDSWIGTDIMTRNRAKFSEVLPNSSDVTTHPNGSFFWGIKTKYKSDSFFLKLYYSYYKWNKSDPQIATILNTQVFVYQPESTESIFGVAIGFHF